jgi:hypothetical protein
MIDLILRCFRYIATNESRRFGTGEILLHGIKELGEPQRYKNASADCRNFFELYRDSLQSIKGGSKSPVFELSTMFLAIRNFATCYALGTNGLQEYARYSALRLGNKSAPIDECVFSILQRARILSTRGRGSPINSDEVELVLSNSNIIKKWMNELLLEVS